VEIFGPALLQPVRFFIYFALFKVAEFFARQFVNMPFIKEDCILIKNLNLLEGNAAH